MIHRSKVDGWLAVVLALAGLLPLVIGLLVPLIGNDEDGPIWLPFVMALVTDTLILAIIYPLTYHIQPSTLLIRSGVLRWELPLADIQEIRPTRNPLSSPALSLDRLDVRYRRNNSLSSIFISPQDKAAFLRDIASATPGLVLLGDRASRTP